MLGSSELTHTEGGSLTAALSLRAKDKEPLYHQRTGDVPSYWTTMQLQERKSSVYLKGEEKGQLRLMDVMEPATNWRTALDSLIASQQKLPLNHERSCAKATSKCALCALSHWVIILQTHSAAKTLVAQRGLVKG